MEAGGAFLAVSFLAPDRAREIAEGVVTDAGQGWQSRIDYLILLRALGDERTLEKLEKLEDTKPSPRVREVWKRTAFFVRQRLSLKAAGARGRWARQELLMLQLGRWDPNRGRAAPALFRVDHYSSCWPC